MKNFSYEFWKDLASIISYFLFAFSLIAPHANINTSLIIIIGGMGTLAILFCGIQMIFKEIGKNK